MPSKLTPAPPAGLPAPVICNVCRGENPAGMKFCRACGAALAADCAGCTRVRCPGMGAQNMIGGPSFAPQFVAGFARRADRAGSGFPPSGPLATPAPAVRPSAPSVARAADRARSGRAGQHDHVPALRHLDADRVRVLPAVRPSHPADRADRSGSGASRARARRRVQPPIGPPNIDAHGATLAQPDAVRPIPNPGGAVPVAVRIKEPSTRAGAAAWGTAVLVNRDGSDGQRFTLSSDDTVVGRAGADIAFDEDRFLAKQHARFERAADGTVQIHALDTLNGVFRKADGPVELADGATVLVGREVLRFERVTPEEKHGPSARPSRRVAVRIAAARTVGAARPARAVGRLSRCPSPDRRRDRARPRGRRHRVSRRRVHVAPPRRGDLGRQARADHRPRQLERHVRADHRTDARSSTAITCAWAISCCGSSSAVTRTIDIAVAAASDVGSVREHNEDQLPRRRSRPR